MIRIDQSVSRYDISAASSEVAGVYKSPREWPPAFKASRSRAFSAGWWLLPSILAGFLVWAMAFRAVLVWLTG